MRLIKWIDKIIHKIPYLPKQLQETCLDRFYKWIEKLAEGW